MSSDLWCCVFCVADESSLQYLQARLSPGDQSHQTGNMLSSTPSSFVCMYSYPDHSYYREDPCILTPPFPFAKGWSGRVLRRTASWCCFPPQFRQSAYLPAQSRHPSCSTHCTEPSLLRMYFFQQQVSLGPDQRAPYSHPTPLALQLRLAQQGPVIATQSKEKEHKTGAKWQAQRLVCLPPVEPASSVSHINYQHGLPKPIVNLTSNNQKAREREKKWGRNEILISLIKKAFHRICL